MTADELDSVMRYFGGCFASFASATAEHVMAAYGASLVRYDHHDVCTAITRLAEQDRQRLPTIGALILETQEAARRRNGPVLALPAPPVGSHSREEALRMFDAEAQTGRDAEKAEAAAYARECGKDDHWLARRFAQIESVGPFEVRARAVIAGEVPADDLGQSVEIARATSPEQRRPRGRAAVAVLPSPPPSSTPASQPTVDETPMTSADLAQGRELAERFLAGERIDVSKLSAAVRRAAREELQRRRKAAQERQAAPRGVPA